MKRCLSLFFCFVFILQGLLFFHQPGQESVKSENRTLTQWPDKLIWTDAGLKQYTTAVDQYFSDRIVWRKKLIELAVKAQLALHDAPNYEKVFRGKEDWWFLGNDYANIIAKLTGNIDQQAQRITDWWSQHLVKNFGEYKKQGVPGIFLLGPNKSSVYGEYLPDFIHPTKRRYSMSTLEKISRAEIPVCDPTSALLAAKSQGFLYWKADTHWNLLGASIAFQAFLRQLRNSFGYDLQLPSFTIQPSDENFGQMWKMAGISDYRLDVKDNYLLIWSEKRNLLEVSMGSEKLDVNEKTEGLSDRVKLTFRTFNGRGASWRSPLAMYPQPDEGQPVQVINGQATSNLKVWLFHDSFSIALSPFYHAIFAETWHFAQADFGKADFTRYGKPDLIIYQSVERSL